MNTNQSLYEVMMLVTFSEGAISPVTKNVVAEDAEKAIAKAKKFVAEKRISVREVKLIAFVHG